MRCLFLQSGHEIKTVPWWYPCLDRRCDERVLQTLHVKVSSYEGTWSRSSRDSGACVEVGGVVDDSNRAVEGCRVRDGRGEGRRAVNVRGVCSRRCAGAGMCLARAARGA